MTMKRESSIAGSFVEQPGAGTHLKPAFSPAPGKPRDALLCDMDLPLHRNFIPLGYSIELLTNDPEVLTAAEESFGHNLVHRQSTPLQIRVGVSQAGRSDCPLEPTRRQYEHLYSLVADAQNQALLDLKTGANFTWLTRAAVSNRLYLRSNFLEKAVYLLLGATVVTDIHAACIGKNGKGILLCGDSGAGKSTLAYACARAGWTFTSDDTSYLINDSAMPRVIGHAHRARFRPSARALFPELENMALTPRMEGKPSIEVPTAKLPIRHTAGETAVHAVVYLSRLPQVSGELVRLADGTATHRTRRELFSAGEIRAKHERILRILWDVPTYELRYSALEDGMRLLDRLSEQL
jgi:hypothetical protein